MYAGDQNCGEEGWSPHEDPATDAPWKCTLSIYHEGDHVAGSLRRKEPYFVWPQK